MEDEDDVEYEYEEGSLRPVALSWRIPAGALLECVGRIFTSVGDLFANLSCAFLAHQLHVEQQQDFHAAAAQELETLTKES